MVPISSLICCSDVLLISSTPAGSESVIFVNAMSS